MESHIVTLRGTVPTLWMKERAREQALKVPDVVTVVSEVAVARGESDEAIAGLVATRLRRYVFLTIFDDADVEVDHGVVTLTGRVTMPYKAEAFADLAARVPGVQEVRNQVKTLPVSTFDDQLRYAVARGIYGDELFARYADSGESAGSHHRGARQRHADGRRLLRGGAAESRGHCPKHVRRHVGH